MFSNNKSIIINFKIIKLKYYCFKLSRIINKSFWNKNKLILINNYYIKLIQNQINNLQIKNRYWKINDFRN